MADDIRAVVRRALAEDRATEDATTRLLGVAADSVAEGVFRAEADCLVAGMEAARVAFLELDPDASFHITRGDGAAARAGDVLATVRGKARALLAAERVALNFLQRLTGVATLTHAAVRAVEGTGARITHTRKTTPGLRALEVAAVLSGGGVPNRASLADAAMWKDNHWVLASAAGLSLRDALAKAPEGLPVIVEVETEAQLEEALAAGARHLLIDNQKPDVLHAWAQRAGPGVTIQASGGITLANAGDYARAGAHLLSLGALTHSAVAIPISMELRINVTTPA